MLDVEKEMSREHSIEHDLLMRSRLYSAFGLDHFDLGIVIDTDSMVDRGLQSRTKFKKFGETVF